MSRAATLEIANNQSTLHAEVRAFFEDAANLPYARKKGGTVAHYLEDEPHSDETPNAVELSPAQVEAFAIRFCPATRDEAMCAETNPETSMEIAHLPHELGINMVDASNFEEVKKAITMAPR